jgi:hydroxyacylglutathione hydrolase
MNTANFGAPFRDLKVDEIKSLIEEGYEIVDVREDWEWKKGHLPGARHVVLNSLLANPAANKFRDRTIFVCQVGERSAVASEMAVALGVKAWRDAGLPLETE